MFTVRISAQTQKNKEEHLLLIMHTVGMVVSLGLEWDTWELLVQSLSCFSASLWEPPHLFSSNLHFSLLKIKVLENLSPSRDWTSFSGFRLRHLSLIGQINSLPEGEDTVISSAWVLHPVPFQALIKKYDGITKIPTMNMQPGIMLGEGENCQKMEDT